MDAAPEKKVLGKRKRAADAPDDQRVAKVAKVGAPVAAKASAADAGAAGDGGHGEQHQRRGKKKRKGKDKKTKAQAAESKDGQSAHGKRVADMQTAEETKIMETLGIPRGPLIDKEFYFDARMCKLPAAEALWSEPEWRDEELLALKRDLNAMKDRLDDKNIADWGKHTGFTAVGSLVQHRVRNDFCGELVTNAWVKMFEMLNAYPLVPPAVIQPPFAPFRSVHLCEVPGAFISATNHFLHTRAFSAAIAAARAAESGTSTAEGGAGSAAASGTAGGAAVESKTDGAAATPAAAAGSGSGAATDAASAASAKQAAAAVKSEPSTAAAGAGSGSAAAGAQQQAPKPQQAQHGAHKRGSRVPPPPVDWRWRATSLNPWDAASRQMLSAIAEDDSLLRETKQSWCFGADYTGDLRRLDNIRALCTDARVGLGWYGADLCTADGSIDCMENPGEQEAGTAQLRYSETVCALGLLRRGGCFVLKIFTAFEHWTVSLLYLLTCCFDRVALSKPATSKAGNSEVYVVCMGYRPLPAEHFSRLLERCDDRWPGPTRVPPKPEGTVMPERAASVDPAAAAAVADLTSVPAAAVAQKLPPEDTTRFRSLLGLKHIPPLFIKQIRLAASMFAQCSAAVIERNIALFGPGNMPEPLRKQIGAGRYAAASEYARRFKLRRLPWQAKLMKQAASAGADEGEGGEQGEGADGDAEMPQAAGGGAGAGAGAGAAAAAGKGAYQSSNMGLDG